MRLPSLVESAELVIVGGMSQWPDEWPLSKALRAVRAVLGRYALQGQMTAAMIFAPLAGKGGADGLQAFLPFRESGLQLTPKETREYAESQRKAKEMLAEMKHGNS